MMVLLKDIDEKDLLLSENKGCKEWCWREEQ